MQDAFGLAIVVNRGLGADLLQGLTAIFGNSDNLANIVGHTCRSALLQKRCAPLPLQPIGTQTKQQWGIFLPQPFEYLDGRCRVGPRLGMRYRNLAAVGKTGFLCGAWLTLNHGDIMTGLL